MPKHTRNATRLATITTMAAAATLALAACGQSAAQPASGGETGAAKDTIVVAAVPAEESANLHAQFDGINKELEKATGKKVTFQQATDYAAIIEGQRAGKIDLAMYGPFSYVIARDGGVPVEPVGALIAEKGGKPGYYSMGWVKADSPITDLGGFKGKKVCFVDKASTSGYLYPSAGLLQAGIDPEKGVTPIMAGGHDASMISVKSGQCDAGFAYEAMQKQLVDKGTMKAGDLKSVWKSDLIAGSPIAMNTKTLDADTQQKIRTTITTVGNQDALVASGACASAEKCPLPEDAFGFVAVKDADYAGIRTVCDVTKADACTAKG